MLCRKQCETDRLTGMLQRRDEDIKRLCQNINEEKSRLTNESLVLIETVGELKNKIAQTENLSQKLEKDLTKATNKLLEAAHRENDLQMELLAKTEKLSYLEQEEYKYVIKKSFSFFPNKMLSVISVVKSFFYIP